MNLVELAEQSYEKFGEKLSLIFNDQEYTNLQLLKSANKLADGLNKLGIKRGDKVLVMLMNSPDVMISYQAILRAGAVIIPVIFLPEHKEVAHIMKNSEAAAIITTKDFLPNVSDARKGIRSLKHVIIVEDEDIPETKSVSKITERCSDELPSMSIKDEDMAVILYTSGTTGVPKGVMLTHYNLYNNAVSSHKLDPNRDPNDVGLFILPLSHSFGLTVMNVGFMFKNHSVMMSWFDLEQACQLIEKYKVTGFAGVPAIFTIMYNDTEIVGKYDLSSLKECVSGSAPLPVEVLKGFEKKFDCIIMEGYGLSEAAPVVTAHYKDKERKPGSIGQPIPDVEIKIVDENNEEVSINDIGELIVNGPNISPGYYKMPDKTKESFRAGWLHTGDMARMDEDGYVFIVDRMKDLIIRGGFNIIPRDIEEILFRHPKVADAAVIGVPDKVMGEEIKAFVVLHPEAEISEEAVIEHCKEYLANYKCLKTVKFLEALPRNVIGKILRKDLRDMNSKL